MIGSIVIMVISSFSYTLIPSHHAILEPSFWYEVPFQAGFSFYSLDIANTLFRMSFYSNVEFIKSHRFYQKIVIIVLGLLFVKLSICNTVWTKVYHNHLPIPLIGYILTIVSTIEEIVAIWYIFPKQWRKNEAFRKRLKLTVAATALNKLVAIPYGVIKMMLLRCPSVYQWIIALFLPLVREIMIWMTIKLLKGSTNGDITRAELACNHAMCTAHAFIIAVILGSIATVETSAVLLGIDFIINLYICVKIIYLNKNRPGEVEKQNCFTPRACNQ